VKKLKFAHQRRRVREIQLRLVLSSRGENRSIGGTGSIRRKLKAKELVLILKMKKRRKTDSLPRAGFRSHEPSKDGRTGVNLGRGTGAG